MKDHESGASGEQRRSRILKYTNNARAYASPEDVNTRRVEPVTTGHAAGDQQTSHATGRGGGEGRKAGLLLLNIWLGGGGCCLG